MQFSLIPGPTTPAALPASDRTMPKGTAQQPRPTTTTDAVLLQKARALESAFLSEMLSHAGLGQGTGDTGHGFGGGIGEDQFASFLRNAQADALVARGGIGLAEPLYRALRGAAA